MRQLTDIPFAVAIAVFFFNAPLRSQDSPNAGGIRSITQMPEEFGDLSHALGIPNIVGGFELRNKITQVGLRFDFYQKGKKLPGYTSRWTFGSANSPASEPINSGRFAIHVIDLDQLPLGVGKPGHQRIPFEFAFGKNRFRAGKEIPKSVFDVKHGLDLQVCTAASATEKEVPLFRMFTNFNAFTFGRTLAEEIARNPDADVLVATLELLK